MRQTHRAGEKMFIDFSGDGIDIVDPLSGECTRAKLFIAVLGASNLTYVEPVQSEDLPTWTGCHVRALEFFGGVADIWVLEYVPRNIFGLLFPRRICGARDRSLRRTVEQYASLGHIESPQ